MVRVNYEDISQGIYKIEKFLIRFLSNLLLGENFLLRNREMHIRYDLVNSESGTVNLENDSLLLLIQENQNITIQQLGESLNLSIRTINRRIKKTKRRRCFRKNWQ